MNELFTQIAVACLAAYAVVTTIGWRAGVESEIAELRAELEKLRNELTGGR